MSENWQITIMTIVSTAATGILGWAAATLAGIRRDLNKKVDREDCGHDMDYHCKRLDRLEKEVKINSNAIASLEARV